MRGTRERGGLGRVWQQYKGRGERFGGLRGFLTAVY